MNTPAPSEQHIKAGARAAYVALIAIVLALAGYAVTRIINIPSDWPIPNVGEPTFLRAIARIAATSVVLTILALVCAIFGGRALATRSRSGPASADTSTPIVAFATIAVIAPLYLLLVSTRVIQSEIGLLLVFLATVLPIAIWQMKTAYAAIPQQVEDAARIDGCSGWQLFRFVIFPMIASAVTAVALFSFVVAWIVCTSARFGNAAAGLWPVPRGPAGLLVTLPPVALFIVLSAMIAPKLRSRLIQSRAR